MLFIFAFLYIFVLVIFAMTQVGLLLDGLEGLIVGWKRFPAIRLDFQYAYRKKGFNVFHFYLCRTQMEWIELKNSKNVFLIQSNIH